MILCDISAEFHLSYKFIIIKIIMYSNFAITSFKHCVLFSRIFEVFNEMEMERNVINNKNFTKFYLTLICINWVPGDPRTIFLVTSFTRKMPESSDSMYYSMFMLENI